MMVHLRLLGGARAWVVALASSVLLLQTLPAVGAAEAPVDVKAKAAAAATATNTVKTAVDALRKEFEAKPQSLRAKCNYITTESNDALADAVLAALEAGGSTPESVYVKWQLLSGLPAQVKDKQLSRLLRIYTSAPALVPHPSLDGRVRAQLDSVVLRLKGKGNNADAVAAEVEKINTEWTAKVESAMAPNKLVLVYRDELFAHLPPTADTVKAGIQDGYERASAGIIGTPPGTPSGATIMTAADNACHIWAANAAPPGELADMKGLVDRIVRAMGGAPAASGHGRGGDDVTDHTAMALGVYQAAAPVQTVAAPPGFPPTVYVIIKANEKGVYLWEMLPAAFATKVKLVDLSKYLADCMKNPGGGLQFKGPT